MPYSTYYHTGGDELNVNAYLLDETVKSNDTKVIQPLLQKFVDYNHAKVRAAGMAPVVWEDMLLHWNLTLGEDVVVQTWQTTGAVAQSIAKGFKTIAGNTDYWISPLYFRKHDASLTDMTCSSFLTAAKANGLTFLKVP